jgi:hypothetical protein
MDGSISEWHSFQNSFAGKWNGITLDMHKETEVGGPTFEVSAHLPFFKQPRWDAQSPNGIHFKHLCLGSINGNTGDMHWET